MKSINTQDGKDVNNDGGPSVTLHFYRHSKKGKDGLITSEGKDLAEEQGKINGLYTGEIGSILGKGSQQCKLYGSGAERTRQTAKYMTNQNQERIRILKNLGFYLGEELKQKDDSQINTPELIAKKKFLDESYNAAYDNKYTQYIVKESDEQFLKIKDPNISAYSKCAGDIAELILEKYYAIKKLNTIKNSNKKYNKKFNRLYVSHQGVSEMFLLKIIEKIYGVDERNKYIDTYLANGGLNFCEGFTVDVSVNDEIIIKFRDITIKTSIAHVKDIIKDRDDIYTNIGAIKKGNEWIIPDVSTGS